MPARRRRHLFLSVLCASVWAGSPAARAQKAPAPQALDTAETAVDWRNRRVLAQAQATAPGAARLWQGVAAQSEALAQQKLAAALRRQLLRLPLGCGLPTPGQLLGERAAFRAAVGQAVQALVVQESSYDAGGAVQLRGFLPFEGGAGHLGALWAALLRESPRALGQLQAGLGPARVQRAQVPVRPATGVVVQARMLGLVPSLWPRIFDTHGRELYGPLTVDADALQARGVASFHDSLESAMRDARVAERPVLIRAERVTDGCAHDVVVDAAAAATLVSYASLLREGRVVFFTADMDAAPPALSAHGR